MIRRCLILLTALCSALPVQAGDRNYYYIVKKDDSATGVLYRAHLNPIYGKIGTFNHLQKLNEKHITDINKIIPGQKLLFSERLALKAKEQGSVELTSDHEIVLLNVPTFPRGLAGESNAIDVVTASPAAAPAPVQEKTESLPEKVGDPRAQSAISISLETGFSRFDSSQNSGSAILLSKPTQGLDLQWGQFWSDQWQSYLGWGVNSISFADTSQGTVLGGEKQTISSLGLGVVHQLSPNLSANFELGVREEIFASSYSAGSATLETKPITYFRTSFSLNLLDVRRLRLSGFLGAGYLMGLHNSNYDIKSGYEYFGGLRITHQLKSFSIFASGEYGETLQDTSVSTQSRKAIRTQIGLSIPLGAEETSP